MNKIILVLAMIMATFFTKAQVKTPQASPRQIVTQTVGLTDVEINYSRPSSKGRSVFGNLVPFGKLWRTGANENTTISFSEDVVIDGKNLPKGKYAIFTIPNIENWDIIFYKTTDNWGTPEAYSDADVVLKARVKAEVLSKKAETFTIGINGLDSNFAFLEIFWENSYVALKFEVPTQKTAMANIDKVLSGPSAGDYFSAAQYLFQSNSDITRAKSYVDKALEMNKEKEKPFWQLRLKSLIQAKQGDKKGAIETAKLSQSAAEIAKNQDYVKMNKDSIVEWSKK
jgi:Protein of unknown function (DUF2911)